MVAAPDWDEAPGEVLDDTPGETLDDVPSEVLDDAPWAAPAAGERATGGAPAPILSVALSGK